MGVGSVFGDATEGGSRDVANFARILLLCTKVCGMAPSLHSSVSRAAACSLPGVVLEGMGGMYVWVMRGPVGAYHLHLRRWPLSLRLPAAASSAARRAGELGAACDRGASGGLHAVRALLAAAVDRA